MKNCHRNCHRTSQNGLVLSDRNHDVARRQSQQNKIKHDKARRAGIPRRGLQDRPEYGSLGEPNRYPAGNGANWVEIVEVQ